MFLSQTEKNNVNPFKAYLPLKSGVFQGVHYLDLLTWWEDNISMPQPLFNSATEIQR